MLAIKKIQNAMRDVVVTQPVITGIALMSKEGLIIQSALENTNDDLIAAAGAILYHLGSSSSMSLSKGEMQLVFIKAKDGYLIVSEVNDESIIMISTSTSDIQIGAIMYDVNEAVKKFKKLLEN